MNLDQKIDEILAMIAPDGRWISKSEFVIDILYQQGHENPMREMIEEAKLALKQAFIDDGWIRVIDVSMPAVTPYDRGVPTEVPASEEHYELKSGK